MIKVFLSTFIFTLFLSGSLTAQKYPLSIHDVDKAMAEEAKPILILLSTDWCMYCHMQKKQLQKNKAFQNNSDSFYYVEFDAENKDELYFQQQHFAFNPIERLHQVAIALNGSPKISFPTWVLLDTDYKPQFRHSGVLLPKHMKRLLQVLNSELFYYPSTDI